jgi:FKBP-type peptidyl-prolyl cis-trans isomerase 2
MLTRLFTGQGEIMKRAFYGLVPLFLIVAVIGCAPATIADKRVVQITYKGTLADGTVFSESAAGTPLEFMFGVGKMIPGLETGIKGLKVGDKKTVTIKAADAYGERDEAALQEVPKSQFPADAQIAVGQVFTIQMGESAIPVTVSAVKASTVIMDFNHPLAGKDLTFDIEVLKIRNATKDELAAQAKAEADAKAAADAANAPATPQ